MIITKSTPFESGVLLLFFIGVRDEKSQLWLKIKSGLIPFIL